MGEIAHFRAIEEVIAAGFFEPCSYHESEWTFLSVELCPTTCATTFPLCGRWSRNARSRWWDSIEMILSGSGAGARNRCSDGPRKKRSGALSPPLENYWM